MHSLYAQKEIGQNPVIIRPIMADLTLPALKAKLESERARLLEVLAGFSAEDLTRPHPDGWSGKEMLAHVAAAERLNVRFAQAVTEQDYPYQVEVLKGDFPDYAGPFALDDFNAYLMARLRDLPLEHVRANLHQVRAETLAWLEPLAPEQLDRSGEHAAWGRLTVRGIVRTLAVHDKMHTQDLAKRK